MKTANAWLNAVSPLIVAHRGASADLPENTLAAFALALDQGADGVECDVRLSKDGQPVLVHDATLARISGNPNQISQLTVAELKKEDCGQGQTVALLSELFNLLGDKTRYNIEIKDFGWHNEDLVRKVAEEVRAFGLQAQTLISSFNPLVIRRAQRYFDPVVAIALLRAPGISRFCYRLVDVDADNPHYSLVDKSYNLWAAEKRLHTFVWTVDEVEEARRLLGFGVQGIITNVPGRLRQQLALT